MLSRVAQRSAKLDSTTLRSYNAVGKQLILPWLGPAYTAARQPRRRTMTTSPCATEPNSILRKRRGSKDGALDFSVRRGLATAAEIPMEDIPFEMSDMPPSPRPKKEDIERLWNVQFDPKNTIHLLDVMAAPPERMRMNNGVTGEPADIYATLEACLRLGRIERAALIIQRSAGFLNLSHDEAGRLHTEFLRASLERISKEPNEEHANAMHKWFETNMRGKGATVYPETVAIMLKASLQAKGGGARQERLVTRYMEMVPGESALEVFQYTDILTAEDLSMISQIVPDHNILAAFKNSMEAMSTEEVVGEELELFEKEALHEMPIVGAEDPSPEVKPSQQKGLGLKSLKASLSMFSSRPAGFDPKKLTADEQRLRQAKVEEDATTSAIDRWREESVNLSKMGLDTSLQTKSLGARMWRWQEALETKIAQEMKAVDEAEAKPSTQKNALDVERCQYGPFLRYLTPEKLAAVTILSAMQILTSYGVDKGVPMAQLVMNVAKAVEDEGITEMLRKNMGDKGFAEFTKKASKGGLGLAGIMKNQYTRRQVTESLAGIIKNDNVVKQDHEWSATIRAKVGSYLLSALFESAKVPVSAQNSQTGEYITQIQPAFSHTNQFRIGKKTGIILANPALVKALQREPVHSLLAKHLPMLVPPEPWSKFNKGGFITQPAKVVRIKNGDKFQRYYQEAAIEKGDMEQIFKGLEVLGKTPWQINRAVYDTMLEAWNSGKAIADFPPDSPILEAPPEPQTTQDPSERRRWLRNLKAIENAKSSMHSIRCFMNFQLEIARAFRDEKFYFPHNVDFRGRAYPIPPYLNHMGADHCRGLLKFGVGKELGATGLKWLRVHLANVHGFDKASLSEREQYAIDHMDDIRDSATNPLNGKRWWLKAEDPWQCLAACDELVAAFETGNPEAFVSNLPVHQDGTCNGLQHYAALGGDAWGAAQVNLEPGDRPADVYSAVADLVKADIAKDLQNGDPCAKWLNGKITRKVVKQTVMTNVYGVTFIGATQQVKKQLIAAYPDIPTSDTFNASTLSAYVAHRIFAALGSMFKGAHDIQYWLGECASRITTSLTPEQLDNMDRMLRQPKAMNMKRREIGNKYDAQGRDPEEHFQFRSSVVWTTPLRMPIVQPYRTTKSRLIKTNLQKLSISEPHRSDPVSKRKQLQGFPPNFIHSLDATHMMLSAIKCDELGLTFAAVHDSFWTHAADVDKMNMVLRDAFIQMHSEDVVGRLKSEFEARHKDSIYLATILPDSEFAQKVAEWRRKVRNGDIKNEYKALLAGAGGRKGESYRRQQITEALLERLRMRLLRSNDPEEVGRGTEMVTPISIYEEMQGKAQTSVMDGAEGLPGLGDVEGVKKNKPAYTASTKAGISTEDLTEEDRECLDRQDEYHERENEEEEGHDEHDEHDDGETIAETIAVKGLSSAGRTTFEAAVGKKKGGTGTRNMWVWLPLSFPEVPEKGSFDVSRLKDSQYFFS